MDKELAKKLEAETPPLKFLQVRESTAEIYEGDTAMVLKLDEQMRKALEGVVVKPIAQLVSISVGHKRVGESRNALQGPYCKAQFSYVGRKWSNKFKKERKLGHKARRLRGLKKPKVKVAVTFTTLDLSSVLAHPLPDASSGLHMQERGRLRRAVMLLSSYGPTGYPTKAADYVRAMHGQSIPHRADLGVFNDISKIRSCQCGRTTDVNILLKGFTPELCPLCNTRMAHWSCSCGNMTSDTIPPRSTLAESECHLCHTKMKEL